jgi:hypothetical protein
MELKTEEFRKECVLMMLEERGLALWWLEIFLLESLLPDGSNLGLIPSHFAPRKCVIS